MTFIQAENEVTYLANRLPLPEVPPEMRVIAVAKEFPEESDRLWKGIGEGAITGDQYVAGWRVLIEKMQERIFFRQLDEKLASLCAEQNNAVATFL